MDIRPLDELTHFELELAEHDPTQFAVIGAGDFVLGRVSRLLVDVESNEVLYLVVNTRVSNYQDDRGEERLVPLAWAELVRNRRQVRLPQVSRFAFRMLPVYRAGEPVPDAVEFPRTAFEDLDFREIA
jgi:hypothetical protein